MRYAYNLYYVKLIKNQPRRRSPSTGVVREARGPPREVADCYRQALDFIHAHPGHYDPEMEQVYVDLIAAKLDLPAQS